MRGNDVELSEKQQVCLTSPPRGALQSEKKNSEA